MPFTLCVAKLNAILYISSYIILIWCKIKNLQVLGLHVLQKSMMLTYSKAYFLNYHALVSSPAPFHARTGTGDETNHAPVNHDHQILTPIRGSRYFCTLYGHGIAHVYVTYYGQGISHWHRWRGVRTGKVFTADLRTLRARNSSLKGCTGKGFPGYLYV